MRGPCVPRLAMQKHGRVCVFYHRVGGRKGCVRADCPFVHSIEDRLNDFFDGVAGGLTAQSVKTLLYKAELYRDTAKVPVHARAGDARQEGLILNCLALELIQEIASESAIEAVAHAVTRLRTEIAATASVVEAVATTEDAPCPYLRFSLFAELERSCAGMLEVVDDRPAAGEREHAEGEDRALRARQNLCRAVAAFEARKLLEEPDGDDAFIRSSRGAQLA